VKTGAFVHQGDRLLTLYSNQEITSEIDALIRQAYTYSLTPSVPKQVVETEVL
jgi:Pyrimidine nucleoside phosphorylase C-terminal domain.